MVVKNSRNAADIVFETPVMKTLMILMTLTFLTLILTLIASHLVVILLFLDILY